MREAVNYSPYVYACRTGKDNSTKTFHLFVLVPIPKRKYISLLTDSDLGISGGFSFEQDTQGIHFQIGTRNTAFGDKFLSGKQMYWATYISFDYSVGNHIADSEDYVYEINIHKNRDGRPDKTISILYGEVDEISSADFYELKDGELALNCPYVYVDQNKTDAAPMALIPEIQPIELVAEQIMTSDSRQTVLQPSGIATAASRQIVLVATENIRSFEDNQGNQIYDIVMQDENEGYSRRPGRRSKMRVRAKKP